MIRCAKTTYYRGWNGQNDEFNENPLPHHSLLPHDPATLTEYERVKQDCELKAFDRLAASLEAAFPQTRFCISGDSLYACGWALTVCEHHHWSKGLTSKRTAD